MKFAGFEMENKAQNKRERGREIEALIFGAAAAAAAAAKMRGL